MQCVLWKRDCHNDGGTEFDQHTLSFLELIELSSLKIVSSTISPWMCPIPRRSPPLRSPPRTADHEVRGRTGPLVAGELHAVSLRIASLEGGSALFGLCAPGRDLLHAEVLRRASRLAVAGRGTPAPDEGRVTENFVARSLHIVFAADAGLVGAIIFLPLSVESVGVAWLPKYFPNPCNLPTPSSPAFCPF